MQLMSKVKPVAIPCCELVFPIQLPFGEHMLFQKMMRLYNDQRSSRFKTYAPFDADDRISDMDASADGKWFGNLIQFFNGVNRVFKTIFINAGQLSFVKMKRDVRRALL